MLKRPRWKYGCVVVSGLCVLVVMSCFLIGAGIQRRTLAPRDLNLALGKFQLMAYTTNRPNCPPYGGRKPPSSAICAADSIYSPAEFYTVWVLMPNLSRPSLTTFRRLVLLPIQ